MLGVNRDHPAVREILQIDAVAAPVEAQLESMVDEALPLHPLSGSDLHHQVDGRLLEHPGPDGGLDGLAAAALDNDRVDAPQMEHVREQEPGRPGSDDPDLCAHRHLHPASTVCSDLLK